MSTNNTIKFIITEQNDRKTKERFVKKENQNINTFKNIKIFILSKYPHKKSLAKM